MGGNATDVLLFAPAMWVFPWDVRAFLEPATLFAGSR